ncbi:hypothetical protein GWK41_04555 [Persephonella atlantica]|uniref:Penicillin-binding protein activator LpoB n=1 Tax=Persephonella atlantica TaxID=2699429 RepID=A0ABS1GHW4_9AQUI|nr:DUF4136 domain-containing protein [Persephonella atlantica]MBK3332337.1 hypothetical protein [Persephonella atlantica]
MKKFLFALVILFYGCSSVYNIEKGYIDNRRTFVVIPFYNNTEMPLAGLRVASIVEGVFASKGYRIADIDLKIPQRDLSRQEIRSLITELKKSKADYVVTGEVNEWRYKTGIDGEPAVSLTLKVISIKSGKTVWIGTGSRSGWGHESLGVTTQKLINELIEKSKK